MGSWCTELSDYMGGWCRRKLNSMGGWCRRKLNSMGGWVKKKSAFFPPPGVFFWNSPNMRIVCQQTILMRYHALFVVFEKTAKFEFEIIGALYVLNCRNESYFCRFFYV